MPKKRSPQKEVSTDERVEEQGIACESAADIVEEKLDWLLPGRLPKKALSILEGEKGASKSTFSAALAAAISTGRSLIGKKRLPLGAVLWLPGEEDVESVVIPRLRLAGADLNRIHFLPRNERGRRLRLKFPNDIDTLEGVVQRYECSLVVIDPLSSHVPSGVSLRDDQMIHECLDPLADLAFARRCVILVNRNLTKNRRDARINRGLGGAAVAGVARAVLQVERPRQDSSKRLLRAVAGNNTGDVPPVEYDLEVVGDYCRAVAFKERKDLLGEEEVEDEDHIERDAKEDARNLLRALLKEEKRLFDDIWKEALATQVSIRTLRAVKVELGVVSKRLVSGGKAKWWWLPIPKEDQKEGG